MTGLLTPDIENRVRHMAQAWDYESTSDLLREALSLLDRQKRLESLRHEIQKGFDSGEATPLDVEEIKRRGRERLAAMVADGKDAPRS